MDLFFFLFDAFNSMSRRIYLLIIFFLRLSNQINVEAFTVLVRTRKKPVPIMPSRFFKEQALLPIAIKKSNSRVFRNLYKPPPLSMIIGWGPQADDTQVPGLAVLAGKRRAPKFLHTRTRNFLSDTPKTQRKKEKNRRSRLRLTGGDSSSFENPKKAPVHGSAHCIMRYECLGLTRVGVIYAFESSYTPSAGLLVCLSACKYRWRVPLFFGERDHVMQIAREFERKSSRIRCFLH